MLFTEEEISRIKITLGYVEFPNLEPDIETKLQTIQDPYRYQKAMSLVYDIEELEKKISEFIPKTFIQNVDGIQLDYNKVISGLKQEATRKLKELAFITNLEVRFNPFIQGGKSISFTSIW